MDSNLDRISSQSGHSTNTKLIILAHHFPWSVTRLEDDVETSEIDHVVLDDTGKRYLIKSEGDNMTLFSRIHSPRQIEKYIHVGCLEMEEASPSLKDTISRYFFEHLNAMPIFVSAETYNGHETYCANNLRPLFHYTIWATAAFDGKEKHIWDCYYDLNAAYVEPVSLIFSEGDYIWIHDYHLFLLPAMIQQRLGAVIGFYLHCIFPSTEVFRCLPQRKELLKGVLGSGLIGFQNYSYARHFISSCTRILGLESSPTGINYHGRLIAVEIFPTGVQVDKIMKMKQRNEVMTQLDLILESFKGKKIIVGHDQGNQSKGLVHKLNAFELFLEDFPEWRRKVVLIHITTPMAYEDSKTEPRVWEAVSRISGKFESLDYTPIKYMNHQLEQDHYLALLSAADALLITSERDAVNETASEFILCQTEKKSPLIISEFVGLAGSFGPAVIINPWDNKGVAHAINDALLMNELEKEIRHRQLFAMVSQFSQDHWGRSYINQLIKVGKMIDDHSKTSYISQNNLAKAYSESSERLFLLDYDGTLVDICAVPEAAVPSPSLLRILTKLTNDPQNHVFIVSGRNREFMDKWLGSIPNMGMAAEHGCFIRYPNGDWESQVESCNPESWGTEILRIFQYYTERTPNSSTEQKAASITWHYRLADPDFGPKQAKELQHYLESHILSKLPVEVIAGKKNLEVKPISANKGEVARKLLNAYPNSRFVFCIGDDRTDEDMFRMVRKSTILGVQFTCIVGALSKATAAEFHILSPGEVLKTLGKLLGATVP